MQPIVWVLLLVTVQVQASAHDVVAGAVKDLYRHFQCDCVRFFSADDALTSATLSATSQRLLSSEGVATSAPSVDASDGSCRHPLHVLLPGGDQQKLLYQLSSQVPLSNARWLLWISQPLSAILNDVTIPFNCEFLVSSADDVTGDDVIISEVYHVTAGLPLQQDVFGTWSRSRGLTAPTGGLYERRGDLMGVELRTVNNEYESLTEIRRVDGRIMIDGFSGEVWKILERRMNFTSLHSVPADGMWGSRARNGTWNGMIRMLVDGDVEVASTGLSMTWDRAEVVSFSVVSLYVEQILVHIEQLDGRPVVFADYLAPFASTIWLSLLGTIVAASLVLAFLPLASRRRRDDTTLLDAGFLMFGAVLCQQSLPTTPRSMPGRIVVISCFLAGVVMLCSYSGAIVSKVSVYRYQLPFSGLEDIYQDKSYVIGMEDNSFFFPLFQEARYGMLRDIYRKSLERNANQADNRLGLEKVCREYKFAYIMVADVLASVADALPCRVVQLPRPFSQTNVGVAFRKSSPFIGIFDFNLLKLQTNGVLSNLYRKSMKIGVPRPDAARRTHISLSEVVPILQLVGAGALLATAMAVVEVAVHRIVKHCRSSSSVVWLP